MPLYSANRFKVACNLLLLTSLFSAAKSASADPLARVHLFVSGKELRASTPAMSDGAEVWAPLDILATVDADGQIATHGDTIYVTEKATGRKLEIAMARVGGAQMIALSDLSHVVDGAVVRMKQTASDHQPSYAFAARLRSVDVDKTGVRVSTSFAAVPVVHEVKSDIGKETCIDLSCTVVDAARINVRDAVAVASQLDPSTVRITLKLHDGQEVRNSDSSHTGYVALLAQRRAEQDVTAAKVLPQSTSANSGHVAPDTKAHSNDPRVSQQVIAATPSIGAAATKTAIPVKSASAQQPVNQEISSTSTAIRNQLPASLVLPGNSQQPVVASAPLPTSAAKIVKITSLSFLTDSQSHARVEMSLSCNGPSTAPPVKPTVAYAPDGASMELIVPGAVLKLAPNDNGVREVNHPFITRIEGTTEQQGNAPAKIKIETARILGYSLNVTGDKITLDIRVPRSASGALADKLIVVDAGHGGSAAGASGRSNGSVVYEKNVTLQIATRLRSALEQCGARVVMTRESDADVALQDRPKLANTIGADLFISIHNDSTLRNRVASGTTTYYHAADSSSRALAECVQNAVHGVSGIPGKGALSDNVLYASGLAVLRGSTMPAVLCEVAYINNVSDCAHLTDPAFQQRVAQAMCDGLRAYVEGGPHTSPAGLRPGIDSVPQPASVLDGPGSSTR